MAQKFGLGKTLAALETEMGKSPEIAALGTMPERVVVRQVPLAQIAANPDQPRKTFAPEELKDLAESIKEHGVLQPIIIRAAATGEKHLFEIVAGERRWRASKLAGKDTIPALVKNMADNNVMEIALIENVQRENLTAIEEGNAYKNLMERAGYTIEDISRLIGKSVSHIKNILRLEVLPDSVKKMIAGGEISGTAARTIAVAENAEELARKIAREKLSVSQITKLVKESPRAKSAQRAAKKPKKCPLPFDLLRQIEADLSKRMLLEVRVSVNPNGSGAFTIKFPNRMQMELLTYGLMKLGTPPEE